MRGEFIGVWSETWREIWLPLIDHEGRPRGHLLRAVPRARAGAEEAAVGRRPGRHHRQPRAEPRAFEKTSANDFAGERALVAFLEAAHSALDELAGDELSNRYFNLLAGFIDKFSLRYDLRRPCMLCPTLPGVFASLVRDLRALTSQDAHLDALMKDFENAVRDLRHDCYRRADQDLHPEAGEPAGGDRPDASRRHRTTTLGAICDQVGTWPHEKLKEAMKNLYGFASDYPGIRHGGTPANALRAVDMRDMVAMSILLTGFTPYLESRLSADAIFGGSVITCWSDPGESRCLRAVSPAHRVTRTEH